MGSSRVKNITSVERERGERSIEGPEENNSKKKTNKGAGVGGRGSLNGRRTTCFAIGMGTGEEGSKKR